MSDMELSPKLDRWIDDNTVDNDFIAHPDFVYEKLLELETEIKKLQAENEQLKKQSQWISVKDKLPKNDDYVLITDSHGFTVVGYFWPFGSSMYRNKGTWYYGDHEQFVTHWMPLPTPPEGE